VCLSRAPLLVLDCRGVRFLDAAGVALLEEADLWSRAHGGRLAVAALPPFAVRVLTLVRLHDRLELFDEVPAAVAALVGGQADLRTDCPATGSLRRDQGRARHPFARNKAEDTSPSSRTPVPSTRSNRAVASRSSGGCGRARWRGPRGEDVSLAGQRWPQAREPRALGSGRSARARPPRRLSLELTSPRRGRAGRCRLRVRDWSSAGWFPRGRRGRAVPSRAGSRRPRSRGCWRCGR
jgi:hypothetical protein